MEKLPLDPALGRIPSGIYILTLRHGDDSTGMLASWAMQAGFEPPMFTVAVRLGRYVVDWIADEAEVALNIVGESQKELLGHFGRGFKPGEWAFEDVPLVERSAGAPVLSEGVGYLDGQLRGAIDSGDHRIFLFEATAGALLGDEAPMTHVRKSGGHY
jgi:flavin reductase (DIM6/NTAB) family NADH-FMN oxidoreductase RutF